MLNVLAISLIIIGAMLMVLAPETWVGVVMLVLGVAIGFIGIRLSSSK